MDEGEKEARTNGNEKTSLLVQPPAKTEEEDSAEVEEQLEQLGFVKAPDGGYGWVVVLASFFANMCVDGIIFTVGTSLLPLWKTAFNASDTEVSLTMSVLAGSYLLVGPLASAFANNYGCRMVVIVGSFISFFGFVFSTIAPHIFVLYITFGLVGGIGFGLVYLPSLVIVSHYFDDKRALATGIAVCGSGIGTSLFANLNPFVLKLCDGNYRIFLCYIACVSLTCILPGIAFKPLTLDKKKIEEVTKIVQEYEQRESRKNSIAAAKENGTNKNGPDDFLKPGETQFDNRRPFLSTVELNAQKMRDKNVWSQKDLVSSVARESMYELNRPLSRADIFYPGSTAALNARSRAPTTASIAAAVSVDRDRTTSNVYLSKIGLPTVVVEENAPPPSWGANLLNTLRSMLDTSLLKRPSFIILALSGFMTLSCFYVPYNYLENHISRIPDISEQSKKIPISLLGIINIIARIGCGYIADRPQVDALFVTNVGVIMAGIATMAVPFYNAYWLFIFYCFPFAFGVACFAALRTVICAEMYGLEKLSSAFGVLLLFMGIGALVGSPIAALIKDLSGNFDISFYVMGGLMTLSGIICFPLRKMATVENEKEEAMYADEENVGL